VQSDFFSKGFGDEEDVRKGEVVAVVEEDAFEAVEGGICVDV
jgi:hypothetical protein